MFGRLVGRHRRGQECHLEDSCFDCPAAHSFAGGDFSHSFSTSAIPVSGSTNLSNAISNYNRRFCRAYLQ
jgi:hypothetical protein